MAQEIIRNPIDKNEIPSRLQQNTKSSFLPFGVSLGASALTFATFSSFPFLSMIPLVVSAITIQDLFENLGRQKSLKEYKENVSDSELLKEVATLDQKGEKYARIGQLCLLTGLISSAFAGWPLIGIPLILASGAFALTSAKLKKSSATILHEILGVDGAKEPKNAPTFLSRLNVWKKKPAADFNAATKKPEQTDAPKPDVKNEPKI